MQPVYVAMVQGAVMMLSKGNGVCVKGNMCVCGAKYGGMMVSKGNGVCFKGNMCVQGAKYGGMMVSKGNGQAAAQTTHCIVHCPALLPPPQFASSFELAVISYL